MSKMKYNKKQRRLHTKKITINQTLIYSGGGGGLPAQAVELKDTVNWQCTYALTKYVSG